MPANNLIYHSGESRPVSHSHPSRSSVIGGSLASGRRLVGDDELTAGCSSECSQGSERRFQVSIENATDVVRWHPAGSPPDSLVSSLQVGSNLRDDLGEVNTVRGNVDSLALVSLLGHFQFPSDDPKTVPPWHTSETINNTQTVLTHQGGPDTIHAYHTN
jgi:hypothetical protein